MGCQAWWVGVCWEWDESMETSMRVGITVERWIGWSIIKFNRWLEEGQEPRQVVEMHNGPGKMMMKSSALSMIHGFLLGNRHEVNTKLELQKAAEG